MKTSLTDGLSAVHADDVAAGIVAPEEIGRAHLAPGVEEVAPRRVHVRLDQLAEVTRARAQLGHERRGQRAQR